MGLHLYRFSVLWHMQLMPWLPAQLFQQFPATEKSCGVHGSAPVYVLGAVAHAVDAMIAGEGCLHRLLQRLVVLGCHVRTPTKLAPHEGHRGLHIHLHTIYSTICMASNTVMCA